MTNYQEKKILFQKEMEGEVLPRKDEFVAAVENGTTSLYKVVSVIHMPNEIVVNVTDEENEAKERKARYNF